MLDYDQALITYTLITGRFEEVDRIQFVFTQEQYLYVSQSLAQIYNKRSYMREYMRDKRENIGRESRAQLSLLFHLDQEPPDDSIYCDCVQARTNGDVITVTLTLKQSLYLQRALKQRYDKWLASKQRSEMQKKIKGYGRVVKTPSIVLVEIPK